MPIPSRIGVAGQRKGNTRPTYRKTTSILATLLHYDYHAPVVSSTADLLRLSKSTVSIPLPSALLRIAQPKSDIAPSLRSHGEWIATDIWQSEVADPPTLEATMQIITDRPQALTAIRTDLGAILAVKIQMTTLWFDDTIKARHGC